MLSALYQAFEKIMKQVKDRDFSPNIVYENGNPAEYASIPLISFRKADRRDFPLSQNFLNLIMRKRISSPASARNQ